MTQLTDMIGLDGLKVGYKFAIIAAEPEMVVEVSKDTSVKLDPKKILSDIQVLGVNPDNLIIRMQYSVDVNLDGKSVGYGVQNATVVAMKEKNRDIKISSDMIAYDIEGSDIDRSLTFDCSYVDNPDVLSGHKLIISPCNNGQLSIVTTERDPLRLDIMSDEEARELGIVDKTMFTYMTKDQAILMARHILNIYKTEFEEGTIRMPNKIMEGLYLIHAGISSSFSGSETYPEARPIMEHAHNCIIEWGREHKIDCHGEQFRK